MFTDDGVTKKESPISVLYLCVHLNVQCLFSLGIYLLEFSVLI